MQTEVDIEELKRDIVFEAKLKEFDFVFQTTWGLFCPRAVDDGTRLLVNQFEINEGETCLDLGCGYGAIGMVMAKLSKTGTVYMVDKDFVAVEYARRNVELNGIENCDVRLSNAFSHLPDTKFDVIVSNLPGNVGKEMLKIILLDAKEHLNPNGRFYVVTILGLREFIKRNFNNIFGNFRRVKHGRNHTVSLAVKRS